MDRNALHHTIPIGHPTWILMNIGLILGIVTVFLLSHKQSAARKNNISKGLAVLLGLNFIAEQADAIIDHTWSVQTYLPLHLCSLSTFLAIYFLIYRNQWVYEFLIFWSAGAIHAFITPEITTGQSWFKIFEFSVSHGGIIITGIFASTQLGFKPRQRSWWNVFLYTQLVLPFIGIINYLLDSNYMYIAQKPNANNPMIIGDWPWYIIGLEFVVLIHFYIFYLLHKKISASNQTTTVPSPLDSPIPHQ
jgi:hypothetical integral membrane protein (TIGR02206 family)